MGNWTWVSNLEAELECEQYAFCYDEHGPEVVLSALDSDQTMISVRGVDAVKCVLGLQQDRWPCKGTINGG